MHINYLIDNYKANYKAICLAVIATAKAANASCYLQVPCPHIANTAKIWK